MATRKKSKPKSQKFRVFLTVKSKLVSKLKALKIKEKAKKKGVSARITKIKSKYRVFLTMKSKKVSKSRALKIKEKAQKKGVSATIRKA